MQLRCKPAVILVLVLTLSVTVTSLSLVDAHTPPWSIPTYSYISVSPNPVGIGQTVIVIMGVEPKPPTAEGDAGDRWTNLRVTITKPNGLVEKKGPFTSDATGSTYFLYNPSMVGNYTLKFDFPGQVLRRTNPINGKPGAESSFINDTFLPSSSPVATLTVREEPTTGSLPSSVAGIITDSVWTKENSPYRLTSTAGLPSNSSLVIEPGVIVNLNGFDLRIDGTLYATGTSNELIYFNGGNLNAGLIIGKASMISHSIFNGRITIGGNAVVSNSTINGRIKIEDGSPSIIGNAIYGEGTADGIYFSDVGGANAVIADNSISGCWRGIAVFAGHNATLERNVVFNNSWGVTVGFSKIQSFRGANVVILNSTVKDNVGGVIALGASNVTLIFNNFQNNSEFAVSTALTSVDENRSSGWGTIPVDAYNNWWGTVDPEAINQSIRDHKVNTPSAAVNFVPVLTEPNPEALPRSIPPPVPEPTPTPVPTATPTSTPQPTMTPNPTSTPTLPPSPKPATPTPTTPPTSKPSPTWVMEQNGPPVEQAHFPLSAIAAVAVAVVVVVLVAVTLVAFIRKGKKKPC